MRNKLALLFSLALLAGLASSAGAQEEKTAQCCALDAMGDPIPKATIQTWHVPFNEVYSPPQDVVNSQTDEKGNFALPKRVGSNTIMVRLTHPEYGTAESDERFFRDSGVIHFPLVRKGAEVESGAFRGMVVDPENHPVAGARVQLAGPWGMGNWLITGTFKGKAVFTDKAGRFAFCIPIGPKGFTFCGAPIPQNSWFLVTVVQPDFSLFPDIGVYRNSEEAVIRLARPERFHRFVFLGRDGKPLAGDGSAEQFTVYMEHEAAKSTLRVRLPANYAVERVKLAPGRYRVTYNYMNRKGDLMNPIKFPEIEVTQDSPEELVCRLPPPVTYTGRVLDGTTGKPLAGAFVTPETPGVDHIVLTKLTAEDWQVLHALPAAPKKEDDATPIRIGELQFPGPILRTDADGKYSITHKRADLPLFCLTFFDEWRMPFRIETWREGWESKADERGHVALPDASLFPAAEILVTKTIDEDSWLRLNWLLEKDDQPEWIARFLQNPPKNVERTPRELKFLGKTPLFVPAGLRLRLSFEANGSTSGWAPRDYPETLLLKPGEVKKIEDMTVIECFEASVRVVDSRGKPLAWIVVKRIYDGGDVDSYYLSRHPTDSAGLVLLEAKAGSSGRFAVAALEKLPPAAGRAKAEVAFRIPADKAPAEPFVITLSDQQIEQLSNIPPPKE